MSETPSHRVCPNPELCEQEFKHINSELSKLSTKFDTFNAKMFESNGLSVVTRLAVLESSMSDVEDSIKDDRKIRGKYTDMIASTLIQVTVTAIMGASALLVLWQRGLLGK